MTGPTLSLFPQKRSDIQIFLFVKGFISQTVYTACTKINYRVVPVTSLTKYLYYGTVQVKLNNMYIHIGTNNSSEKL